MPNFLFFSAVFGFFSVALGAFGAHALRDQLDAYHLSVFKTGVEYQFFHTFALALTALLLARSPDSRILSICGWLFTGGILIFSGSLYALALTKIKWWGAVTPIGGVCFLISWALLAYAAAHPTPR